MTRKKGQERRGREERGKEEKTWLISYSLGATRCFSLLFHKCQEGSFSSSLNLHGNGSNERERREKERGGDGGSHKEI